VTGVDDGRGLLSELVRCPLVVTGRCSASSRCRGRCSIGGSRSSGSVTHKLPKVPNFTPDRLLLPFPSSPPSLSLR
jgi:hypothetical protein